MEKGSGTRSGLLWEVERLLDECNGELPQVLLMENVPQVIGKGNIEHFNKWRTKLESLGYSNFVQLLNAKEIGYPEPIPQNRNRCFMVSILGNYHYTFPHKQKLNLRLKDMLDEKVDDKYYLSNTMLKGMLNTKFESYKLENKLKERESIASTIISRFEGTPQCVKDEINVIGNTTPSNHEAGRVFDTGGGYCNNKRKSWNSCEGTYEPYGTIYANASEKWFNPPMKDLCRTLKAEKNDTSVVEIKK